MFMFTFCVVDEITGRSSNPLKFSLNYRSDDTTEKIVLEEEAE